MLVGETKKTPHLFSLRPLDSLSIVVFVCLHETRNPVIVAGVVDKDIFRQVLLGDLLYPLAIQRQFTIFTLDGYVSTIVRVFDYEIESDW